MTRFVMFASGLLLHTTVWKGYKISSGDGWGPAGMCLSVAALAGPWLLSRAVLGSKSLVARYNGAFQVFTTRCSVGVLSLAVVTMIYVLDRAALTPADAFPSWLAAGILLAVGLLFALYDMNLPPLCPDTPAPGQVAPARVATEPVLV